jgi:multimeric flavodoxin WrbA
MKVLAINGSARKDGNTALLINTVFEELHREGIETEMVQLSGKVIEPCKACWACGGKGTCVHKKDLFQEIYEKMIQADGILLGSPVYTANISANMQAFLERASVVADMNRSEDLLRHKVGAAVTRWSVEYTGCHESFFHAAEYVSGWLFLLACGLWAAAWGSPGRSGRN